MHDNAEETPALVLPASPKSVYRLAHLLELAELQLLALKAIKSNIKVKNVLIELTSEVARAYPEVQKIAYDFARDHWEEVELSEGMKTVLDLLEKEKLPAKVGSLLFRLGRDGRQAAAAAAKWERKLAALEWRKVSL